MNCKAYKLSTGDFVCDRCKMQWDKDDCPPECTPEKASKRTRDVSMRRIRKTLE